MMIEEILNAAKSFSGTLASIKASQKNVNWYPFESMNNIDNLNLLLKEQNRNLVVGDPAHFKILDIGAADGDLAFLFEKLGCHVDVLDNASTNFNDCKGIMWMKVALGSSVRIMLQDVDWFFRLDDQYDLAIALGILYHLRNPFLFLSILAMHSKRMLLSTRIAAYTPEGRAMKGSSIAYFLKARESNNDPTNYWIFSDISLQRLLARSGWNILDWLSLGAVDTSNPTDNNQDERVFVYCERVSNYMDLTKHHDFG